MAYSESTNVRRRARVDYNACGLGKAAEILGDKWILLILREALFDVIRFEDIRGDLQIPKSILAKRLALLVDNNILEKKPYREASMRVRHSYHLTRRGRGLFKAFLGLMEWGNEFLLDSGAKYIFIDKQTRLPVKLGLIDSSGQQVPQKSVIMSMTKRS